MMINDIEPGLIELRRKHFFGQRKTHGVCETLPQRAGGRFDAHRQIVLRVSGRAATELTKIAQFLDGDRVTGQMQHCVQKHRGVTVRKYEAVAIPPTRIGWVVLEELAPQHFRHIRHAHGRAGVTGVGLLDCVHGQDADDIGEFAAGRHSALVDLIVHYTARLVAITLR